MPHNPYHFEQPRIINWPLIILIALGVLVLILIVIFVVIPWFNHLEPTPAIDSSAAKVDCSSDTYNCADFTTQAEAQAVFDFCGPGDIHQLDGDGNGKACEGLAQ